MLKTFTLVRMLPGQTRDEFYDRWCAHTRDFDLRDHPEISLNRLILFDEATVAEGGFIGMAENHWPSREALEEVIRWYQTPPGIAHNADLEKFMDIANSPTSVVEYEVEVSQAEGVAWKAGRGHG